MLTQQVGITYSKQYFYLSLMESKHFNFCMNICRRLRQTE